MQKRKRLSQEQKAAIVKQQEGCCWYCGDWLKTYDDIAYHHPNELEISGDDSLANRVAVHHYPCHDILTNGTGATTLNSSKHRIAKVKRLEKLRLEGEPKKRKRKWPSRPMRQA